VTMAPLQEPQEMLAFTASLLTLFLNILQLLEEAVQQV
jgi:hypothetical protein